MWPDTFTNALSGKHVAYGIVVHFEVDVRINIPLGDIDGQRTENRFTLALVQIKMLQNRAFPI